MLEFEKINFKFIEQPHKNILVGCGKEQFKKNGQMRLLDQKYNMIYTFLESKFKNHDIIKICKSKTTFSIYICIYVRNKCYSIRISNHNPDKYRNGNSKIIHSFLIKMNSFVDLYSLYIDVCRIYKEFVKKTSVNYEKIEDLFFTYSATRAIRKTHPQRDSKMIRETLLKNLDKVV